MAGGCQGGDLREDRVMKRLFCLAVFAGLALAGSAAPAHDSGAFGLLYDRCTGCCAGCPKPWNAFSDGHAPANWYGQYGCEQMPCMPYQGPGDPLGGHYKHQWFVRYGCGDPNVGCGMGCGPGCLLKEA